MYSINVSITDVIGKKYFKIKKHVDVTNENKFIVNNHPSAEKMSQWKEGNYKNI